MVALGFLRRRETAVQSDTVCARELAARLDAAAVIGNRLTEKLRTMPAPNQSLANAASICRWELTVLRERIRETPVDRPLVQTQNKMIQHLDGAGSAAATLSRGYRVHDLDSICRGGESFDDHLEALARIRERLIAS